MNKPYKYKDSFYFFDHDIFNDMFNRKCNRDRLMIKDMEEQLAMQFIVGVIKLIVLMI